MAQTLSSVRQALRVLELLQDHPALGVSEIARTLEVSSSTAHRLLATMLEAGFVRQVPAGRKYQLGPAMQSSRNASLIEDFIEAGAVHMMALRDDSSETVHLAVLRRTDTHFVAAYESPHIMRVTSRVGWRLPAHTTAAGKLLLSALTDEALTALYADRELAGQTAGSITSFDGLLSAIRVARDAGYARNMVESELGIAALAVPLRTPQGEVVCSLTVTGPDSRFNPTHSAELSRREEELLSLLRSSAALIEADIASHPHFNTDNRR